MTREEIEKLSAVEPYCFETDSEKRWYEIGCIDGLAAADAEPNLGRLWHNASKKPHAKEWILIQFGKDDYTVIALNEHGVDIWFDVWCKEYNASRWAYISDLLPKGGEI